MTPLNPVLAVCALLATIPVLAETGQPPLHIAPVGGQPRVFAGEQRRIPVLISNSTDRLIAIDARLRLYQATSATVVLQDEKPWKQLRVLPEQTVLETVTLGFPAVRAETRYLAQFLHGTNVIIGTMDVKVYPRDLLNELRLLANNLPIGVFDPQDRLKPALKRHGLDLLDLEDAEFDSFTGKLALIGPLKSVSDITEEFSSRIKKLAANGVGVVWIQPPPMPRASPQPSFYRVTEGAGEFIIVQPDMVSDLDESPRSQLNLIHFSQLAVRPEPPRFPNANHQAQ
jgi:hypothetical protein